MFLCLFVCLFLSLFASNRFRRGRALACFGILNVGHVLAVGPKTVRAVVPFFMQSCHHHAMTISRTSSYVDRDTQGGYEGVGGWVGGGIITFGTTYIMSLYHHHHFITQSSCHHHAIPNFCISSYVDRDTQAGYGGGGWVGGIITFGTGTTYIMSLYHHHHFITQSSCHHHAISNLRKDIPMYIRMWQWRHWHSSQHASLLTLTSKALSKKRNE